MRKLGEQWIEIIDGQEHMVKAVKITRNSWPVDNGFRDGYFFTNNKIVDEKYSYYEVIKAKDLGILRDGMLPCPYCGEYMEILTDADALGFKVRHVCSGAYTMVGTGVYGTKQQVKDGLNRRS